jgi:hypothetical protein
MNIRPTLLRKKIEGQLILGASKSRNVDVDD